MTNNGRLTNCLVAQSPIRTMNRIRNIRPGSEARREEVREVLAVLALTVLFLGGATLFLWLLEQASVSLALAKGYGVFWLLLYASVLLLTLVERLSGLNADDHYTTYVSINLAVSVVLVAGWSAFSALTMGHAAASATGITAGCLYAVGFLSCYVAFAVTSAFYKGSFYKVVDLPLALVGFIVVALWPWLGRMIYGWFFALFGMHDF